MCDRWGLKVLGKQNKKIERNNEKCKGTRRVWVQCSTMDMEHVEYSVIICVINNTKCLFILDMVVWHRWQLDIFVIYLMYVTSPFTNFPAQLNFVCQCLILNHAFVLCLSMLRSSLGYKVNILEPLLILSFNCWTLYGGELLLLSANTFLLIQRK